jgi:hypothetical protein
MPLWHCTKCHHEWESVDGENCDWCGAPGRVLEDKTPMEKVDWGEFIEKFSKIREESMKIGQPIVISVQEKKRKEKKHVTRIN